MCLRNCADNIVFPGTGNFDFRPVTPVEYYGLRNCVHSYKLTDCHCCATVHVESGGNKN